MTSAAALWLGSAPLVLASGSTTRRDMLLAAGIPVEVIKPDIDERAVEASLLQRGLPGEDAAPELARAKALAVSRAHAQHIVLGADQTLICEGVSHHKPADAAAARAQIAVLSGRTHQLRSAFVLAQAGEVIAQGAQTADLTMRNLSPDFIAAYVDAMGPSAFASVGGYQIEGLGAQLFDTVEGDHFTILGLPLLAVLTALRGHGLLAH
ncbi:septum formation protein [Bosea sp. BE125]|uniref:Maf family protein n=1 Tax=Bosea sp. BE125 TaxID=2817909 RepID=UPI002857528C|nr:Maf family protein [Bosea sp. BE125]MDR6874699.1 septum formation protein [Bosea sp. BE125]